MKDDQIRGFWHIALIVGLVFILWQGARIHLVTEVSMRQQHQLRESARSRYLP